jgi:hypothetical protein
MILGIWSCLTHYQLRHSLAHMIMTYFCIQLGKGFWEWGLHHYQRRAAQFRTMLGAHRLWVGKNLYRAISAVTRCLGFPGLTRKTTPFSHLLRHTRECGISILTRLLTSRTHLENSICISMHIDTCT